MVSPHIFFGLNLFLYLGVFILIVMGFQTSQWAVYSTNCGCDSDCIYFIGLFKAKFTKLGHCGYKVKDVDCNDFNLSDDDCDYYESARDASQLTLALVVVLLVWKFIFSIVAYKSLETRKRILWIIFLLATLGDIAVGFAAFITAGQFDQIDDWNIINVNTGKKIHFDQGYGWQCFIGGGVVSWAVAVLGGFTLWRGFSTTEEQPTPPLPIDGNTK
jgi:hypothetical protein